MLGRALRWMTREPRYLETKKGRVALLSMCTGNDGWEMAENPRGGTLGRPGLALIRLSSQYTVDEKSFEELKKIAMMLKLDVPHSGGEEIFVSDTELNFLRNKFKVGDKPGCRRTMNKKDVEDCVRWIKDARRNADWVLVGYHCHETSFDGMEYPAEFQTELAHACIDAGTNVFLGHGPIF